MTIQEETLDPQDWDELRALGHRMVDDMLTYLQTVRDRPVWQPIPNDVKEQLHQPLPAEPQGADEAYQDFLTNVLPHPMGNIHPRFWGWVIGTGTPFGALSEMLAATINPNMGGGDHVPNYVERQVLDWCKEMLGFPPEASGLLVSGGSMANFVGLAVARNSRAGFDVRAQGVAASPKPMTFYGSVEMHSCLQKAVELLGLGNDALRRIPVNADYQIDLAALDRAIQIDRAAGLSADWRDRQRGHRQHRRHRRSHCARRSVPTRKIVVPRRWRVRRIGRRLARIEAAAARHGAC